MLTVKDITVTKGGNELLMQMSFRAEAGKILAIVGPNGAGKSSLIKALSGEWSPDQGDICYDQRSLSTLAPRELAPIRAVMPQSVELDFPFQVGEVLEMAFDGKMALETQRQQLRQVMEWLDIGALLTRNYLTLSGGEQQRVNLARVILQLWSRGTPENGARENHENLGSSSQWLLLDECTASLDIHHQHLVFQVLRRLSRQHGYGILMVLHDLNLASQYADTVMILKQGAIQAQGETHKILIPSVLQAAFEINTCVIPHPDGWSIIVPA